MSPSPDRPRFRRRAFTGLALLLGAGLAACADGPTAARAPSSGAISLLVAKPTVTSFCNNTRIDIPVAGSLNGSGPASPYPSPITVAGLSASATRVTVTLNDLRHNAPWELGVLLVGPTGYATVLMSHVSEDDPVNPSVTLTFDDDAGYLPYTAPLWSGTFRPTSYYPFGYPAPAPSGPYPTSLAGFTGQNPNGTWKLYVVDVNFGGGTVGTMGSWCVNIEEASLVRVLPTADFGATPGSVPAGQSLTLSLTNAQVPGFPSATAFTYAFDCGDGAGYSPASSSNSASCPTTVAGGRTVRGRVIDQDGDAAEYSAAVDVVLASQAIAFTSSPPSPAYFGATYDPTATGGGSGNPVTFSTLTPLTCSVSDGTVELLVPGTCTVAADQAGNATYAAAPQQTQRFTVVQQQQTITVTSSLPASAFLGTGFTLSATGGASDNAVVFASQTPATCTTSGSDGATLTLVAVGSCTVQATQAGSVGYAAATPVEFGLTVVALTPAQRLTALRAQVAGSGIKADVRRGLTDKLDAAIAAVAEGNAGVACNNLASFVNQVQAQRGKAIVAATADAWLAEAAVIRTALGC